MTSTTSGAAAVSASAVSSAVSEMPISSATSTEPVASMIQSMVVPSPKISCVLSPRTYSIATRNGPIGDVPGSIGATAAISASTLAARRSPSSAIPSRSATARIFAPGPDASSGFGTITERNTDALEFVEHPARTGDVGADQQRRLELEDRLGVERPVGSRSAATHRLQGG